MTPGECESCAAPIVWAKTDRGERMPVDADPSPTGNVLLTGAPPHRLAGVLNQNQAAGARDAGQRLHLSHFASCPMAGAHRRRQRRS